MISKNGKIIIPSQFAAKQRALNAAKQQDKHEDTPRTPQNATQGPCDSKGDTTHSQPIKLPFIVQIQPLTLRDRICLSSRWIFDSLRSMFTSFPKYALFHLPNPDHPDPIKAPVMRQILSQRQYSELNSSQPPTLSRESTEQSNTHSQNK